LHCNGSEASVSISKTIERTSSDGFFNFGSALSFAQLLPEGVYITMNGKYFARNNVKKNRQTGFF
jgi:L-asparaginase